VVARFGGEEFVTVLAATTYAGGMEMAERLRRSVEKMTVPSDGGSFGFTISIGVTVLSAADEDASVPIARADEAMYRAKMLGRNRVFGEPASATA
jgi:diguanylate cyclase (GGDEF)-like protein